MKTYSVAIKSKEGHWITNWHEYSSLQEIDWEGIKQFVNKDGRLGYGYYYGNNSRNLCSSRTRTVLFEKRLA